MWARFCIMYGLASSLICAVGSSSDSVMLTFISFMLHARQSNGKPYAFSSLGQYLTAIHDWHIKNGRPDPTNTPHVRRGLNAARKFCKNLGRVKRKWPLSASIIRLWKASLDLGQWNARVFYAAALLAFFGLHRVSEFAITTGTYKGLRRGNIEFGPRDKDGNLKTDARGVPLWVTIELEFTKTDTLWRYGGQAKYFLSGGSLCLVSALWAILKYDVRPKNAPLFILSFGGKMVHLSRRHVSGFVKAMAKLAGLPTAKFDTHSFRAGGACALWAAGYSAQDIQLFGRWRSDCWRIYVCPLFDGKLRNLTTRMAEADADGIFYAQIHDRLRINPIRPLTIGA